MKKYTHFILFDHIGNFYNFVFSLLMLELYYSPICWGWPVALMSGFEPGRQPGAEREEGT